MGEVCISKYVGVFVCVPVVVVVTATNLNMGVWRPGFVLDCHYLGALHLIFENSASLWDTG